MERRLAAVLAADVVGYSRLMEASESETLSRLREHRETLIRPAVTRHNGHIVKFIGDGILAEFPSAADAVRFAIGMQKDVRRLEAGTAEGQRVIYRIGINLGDVIVEDGDIYGDGVNVAARLEGMADPGGILISQPVRDSIAHALDETFFDNGERKFKNISRTIRVWSWPRALSALRAEGKPRLFLGQFEGRSDDEKSLASDLVEELRSHLARLTGLELAGTRENAHYLVEGAVRLVPPRSRVFARLTALDGDRQIWSDRYEGNTGDLFDILDRCCPRMAMSIRRRVAADDAAPLSDRPLDELSFEQLLALAGVSFFTPTKAGWRGGGEISEQILELQPKSFMALAMAAAGLGLAEYLYGYRAPEKSDVDLAFNRIEESLRLNSRSDMPHVTNSMLHLFARRQHRDAAAAARRALELNPEYNMGLWALGAAQVFGGEPDLGAQSAMRAVGVDLRDPYVHLYSRVAAYGHLGAQRIDEALDWFQRADQLAPGGVPNIAGLAVCRILGGNKDGAQDEVHRLLRAEPGFRLSDLVSLPYSDGSEWQRFADALRQAGAPE